jgi:DNA-binding MarR family transcriptional regulator
MNNFMQAHNIMREAGFRQPSLLQLAFLASLGGRAETLETIAKDLDRSPSTLKYTLGALCSSGMVSVTRKEISLSTYGQELRKRLPAWVNYADEGLQSGVDTIYGWALLEAVNDDQHRSLGQICKELGLPTTTAQYCAHNMVAAGLLTHIPVFDSDRMLSRYAATNIGQGLLERLS